MKTQIINGAKYVVMIFCIIAVLFLFASCETPNNNNERFIVGKVVEVNSVGYIILESGDNLWVSEWHNPLIGTVVLGETYKFKVHTERNWGYVVDSIYYYEQ